MSVSRKKDSYDAYLTERLRKAILMDIIKATGVKRRDIDFIKKIEKLCDQYAATVIISIKEKE